jgi:hypothetical protein
MATCVPCISAELKKAIRKVANPITVAELDKIDDCPDDVEIQFCGRKPRKQSEYQKFMSVCMKGGGDKSRAGAGKSLRECAETWRKQKES